MESYLVPEVRVTELSSGVLDNVDTSAYIAHNQTFWVGCIHTEKRMVAGIITYHNDGTLSCERVPAPDVYPMGDFPFRLAGRIGSEVYGLKFTWNFRYHQYRVHSVWGFSLDCRVWRNVSVDTELGRKAGGSRVLHSVGVIAESIWVSASGSTPVVYTPETGEVSTVPALERIQDDRCYDGALWGLCSDSTTWYWSGYNRSIINIWSYTIHPNALSTSPLLTPMSVPSAYSDYIPMGSWMVYTDHERIDILSCISGDTLRLTDTLPYMYSRHVLKCVRVGGNSVVVKIQVQDEDMSSHVRTYLIDVDEVSFDA
ncbi:hypothetical protein KIPB_008444 [Kipferlia bialata]|uniref:Uncharacterized protein n=1 Tax=Kipferlia bialata TaxID=797122 RepID=A0A391NT14_9EUKA|nr:hypothetical protein KIPB_008444 [Kipferlia bialata]|eukprot:g8444.t1